MYFHRKNLQHFPARHVKANCNSPTFCSDCSSLSIRIERFRLIEAARRRRWRIAVVAAWEKLFTLFSLSLCIKIHFSAPGKAESRHEGNSTDCTYATIRSNSRFTPEYEKEKKHFIRAPHRVAPQQQQQLRVSCVFNRLKETKPSEEKKTLCFFFLLLRRALLLGCVCLCKKKAAYMWGKIVK